MLVLNLHRHWHAEIAEGRKTVEYRVVCPYWRSRLEKLAPGDVIRFRRGYYDRSSDIEATVDGIDFGPTREGTATSTASASTFQTPTAVSKEQPQSRLVMIERPLEVLFRRT